jgi:hypothetical protein
MKMMHSDEIFESNLLQNIEDLEQQLIQHIRISGVRKQRETSLIDEALNIRKERRKLISSLSSNLRHVFAENNALRTQLVQALSVKSEAEAAKIDELKEALNQKTNQFDSLNVKYQRDIQTLRDRLVNENKTELEALTRKHETKLRLLESKINELADIKANNSTKLNQETLNEILDSAKNEMENKYGLRIQK